MVFFCKFLICNRNLSEISHAPNFLLVQFQMKKKDAKSKLDEIGALFKPVQEQKISAGMHLSSLIPEVGLWLVQETYKHPARFSDRWWQHGRLGQRKADAEMVLFSFIVENNLILLMSLII